VPTKPTCRQRKESSTPTVVATTMATPMPVPTRMAMEENVDEVEGTVSEVPALHRRKLTMVRQNSELTRIAILTNAVTIVASFTNRLAMLHPKRMEARVTTKVSLVLQHQMWLKVT